MMAKIVVGSNFGGAVKYVMSKTDAELLAYDGVITEPSESIVESFEMQASMRPISKPVAHISLDFSSHDKTKMTNNLMIEIAREYMNRMGYGNTQYIVVRHNDREHPHLHLVLNRVDFDGKRISDQNERLRSVAVCKDLTVEYGLYFAQGKEYVKRHRLKEPVKTKYEIYDAIKDCLPKCSSWNALTDALRKRGVMTTFKYKGSTAIVEGVKFSKNGYTLSGSRIDTAFSYAKLNREIEHHRYEAQQSNFNITHISDSLCCNGGDNLIENIATNNAISEQDEFYNLLNDEKRRKCKKKKGIYF